MRIQVYLAFWFCFSQTLIPVDLLQALYAQEGLDPSETRMILVIGAGGNQEYDEQFSSWAQHWLDVAEHGAVSLTTIGNSEPGKLSDREQLKAAIEAVPADLTSPLWIVLIGHGTFARQMAKFNLRGPDVSATDMAAWLQPRSGPIVVVNCASSSAPFINRLSGKNRIVVTATKSGTQYNYARFGEYFARAIASPESDLDHDDEVSVHEAFLRASAEVQQFYDAENRIATEQALIDDNGDGRGTPAKMFRGVHPISEAKDGKALDGKFAMRVALSPSGKGLPLTDQERRQRAELENKLDQLRVKRAKLSDAEFDSAIEPLMIELARIYKTAEQRRKAAAELDDSDSQD